MSGAGDGALVLLSGGQDSTTCLAWALDRFERVETVGFDYGQRHRVELACREAVRAGIAALGAAWAARLGADHLLAVPVLGQIGETAMTSEAAIAIGAGGMPTTFVPGRNLVFLALAAALACRRDLRHIVLGVCETDYSGYPDCRDDTVKAMQVVLNLGMQQRFVLHTPLMWRTKAATWALANRLGGEALVRLIVDETHSCYRGDHTHRHAWGYGCADCPACDLRALGWAAYRARGAEAAA